jgi:hypothetical protein
MTLRMLLLPFTDEILYKLLVLRVLCVDTHLLDLVQKVDPTLIDILAHKALVGDVFKVLESGHAGLVRFDLASRGA